MQLARMGHEEKQVITQVIWPLYPLPTARGSDHTFCGVNWKSIKYIALSQSEQLQIKQQFYRRILVLGVSEVACQNKGIQDWSEVGL